GIRLHRKYAARLTPMCASPQGAILAAYRFAITLAVHNADGLLATQTYKGVTSSVVHAPSIA
ncbi:MAG: hypothetical protein IJO90_02535, partial [Alistipes sp.]|nr:hypothetical protein [Alistipes sp.]